MADLEPHQQRMLEEQEQLTEIITKLKTFIDESPVFEKLHIEDQLDLRTQHYYMIKYSNALQVRIDKEGI